jgi:hypothetical protein
VVAWSTLSVVGSASCPTLLVGNKPRPRHRSLSIRAGAGLVGPNQVEVLDISTSQWTSSTALPAANGAVVESTKGLAMGASVRPSARTTGYPPSTFARGSDRADNTFSFALETHGLWVGVWIR